MPTITLFLCGDVMTGRGIDQVLVHPSAPDLYEPYIRDARDYVALAEVRNGPIPRPAAPDYVWGEALGELERVDPDARIVNLETSVTSDGRAVGEKGIHYRMHPENVGCLTAARVDVCVLANNHVLDWDEVGLSETLDTLHAVGIRTVGAGRDIAEAQRPAIVSRRAGGSVKVFGVGDPSSGVPPEWAATAARSGLWLTGGLSDDAAEEIGAIVQRDRRRGEVAVVSIHWGSNWGYEVPDRHVRFAHALVERGVDVVHGHSSHHPRPIEVYRDKLILYGCGDFLNDYEGITGHEAYRCDLPILYLAEYDAPSARLVSVRLVPMRLRRMRLERASTEETAWTRDQLARVSRPFGTRVVSTTDALQLALKPQGLPASPVPRF
jgi:poly-gamma-glutamate synthesis protein (capsule biosynthesis protein)